jgi:hypothetical protein
MEGAEEMVNGCHSCAAKYGTLRYRYPPRHAPEILQHISLLSVLFIAIYYLRIGGDTVRDGS